MVLRSSEFAKRHGNGGWQQQALIDIRSFITWRGETIESPRTLSISEISVSPQRLRMATAALRKQSGRWEYVSRDSVKYSYVIYGADTAGITMRTDIEK